MNESLDMFVREIVNSKVQINELYGEFVVPRLVNYYRNSDFGKSESDFVDFIYEYL